MDKPGLPQFWKGDEDGWKRKTAQIASQLQRGEGNNSFTVNLEDNETETIVIVTWANTDHIALVSAKDAATAAAIASGSIYAVASKGKITITHDSQVGDRRLAVAVFG